MIMQVAGHAAALIFLRPDDAFEQLTFADSFVHHPPFCNVARGSEPLDDVTVFIQQRYGTRKCPAECAIHPNDAVFKLENGFV